jgi:hypothetical protein
MTTFLYDIAGTYQPGFNVVTAKREGYIGGISKITEGLSSGANWDVTNKAHSRQWYQDSVNNGQIWGGYHYLRKGNGAAQARYFLDEFNKITGHGVRGHLVQLDNESDADWQTTVDWSNEFYRQTNNHPYLMYTGNWWWNVAGRRWNGNSLTPYLWHSSYVGGTGNGQALFNKVPNSWWLPGYGGWSRASILQFSSKGSCGGIVNNVDVNAIQMDINTLLGIGGNTTVAGEADKAFVAPYTGTEGWINGQSWMAKAIESPLNRLLTQLDAVDKRVQGLSAPVPAQIDLDALADKVLSKLTPSLAVALEQAFAEALQRGSQE